MLNDNELDATIASFMARKQKQFPDINLLTNHDIDRASSTPRARTAPVDKNYRRMKHKPTFA